VAPPFEVEPPELVTPPVPTTGATPPSQVQPANLHEDWVVNVAHGEATPSQILRKYSVSDQ
jgi:hypothetical protein